MNKTLLTPYLNFNGDCRQAMEFYRSVLGGELEVTTFAEFADPSAPLPEGDKDKIMHAMLKSDTMTLMASDGAPGHDVVFGDSVHLSLSGDDDAVLTQYFNGLSEGGTVTMPLDKQPWGDKFGMLTDKYGMHWMVNIAQPKADVPTASLSS